MTKEQTVNHFKNDKQWGSEKSRTLDQNRTTQQIKIKGQKNMTIGPKKKKDN